MKDETDLLCELFVEVRRLKLQAKCYKEELESVIEAAEDYVYISRQYVRGRPGDEHPTTLKLNRLRSLIDRAQHIDIYIDSMTRWL